MLGALFFRAAPRLLGIQLYSQVQPGDQGFVVRTVIHIHIWPRLVMGLGSSPQHVYTERRLLFPKVPQSVGQKPIGGDGRGWFGVVAPTCEPP